MPANIDRLIAAGNVLESFPASSQVAAVYADGKYVCDPTLAVEAYRRAKLKPNFTTPSFIDRYGDKLADNVDSLEERLGRYKVGRRISKLVMADPEHVARSVTIDVTMRNGKTTQVPVEVLHRRETAFLQRFSEISEAIATIPIAGLFVPPISAALAGVGSLLSGMLGRLPLARALRRTATKHLALTVTGLMPFLGTATSLLAAAVDHRDHTELQDAPIVSRPALPAA